MKKKYLLIAERFNMRERPSWNELVFTDVARWIELSLQLQAFRPEYPQSRDRLRLVGIDLDQRDLWDSMNLLPPAPQGVKWNAIAAGIVSRHVMNHLRDNYDLIALCGTKVSEAFYRCHKNRCPLGYARDGYLRLPHPSGLSRFWNDELEIAGTRAIVEESLCNAARSS